MANTPISGFTSGSPAQSTDEFVIARSGSNFKLTGSDLKTLSVGAGSVDVASGKTLTASNTLTLAGTDGTTMTFPSTSATLARTDAGNTFTGAQTFSIGTVNGTGLNLTQTWSGTGTYTGLQYNVTDSGPANAASLLLDLQVGGSSVSQISKAGMLSVRTGSYNNPGLRFGYTGNNGLYWSSGLFVLNGGTIQLQTSDSAVTLLGDIPLSRRGAANLRLGAADAAAPVAQTLSVQSVVAGTSNTAGANLTITGSQGTGTGAGGSIIFQVAPAGSSGTAQNALVTRASLNSEGVFELPLQDSPIFLSAAFPKIRAANLSLTTTGVQGGTYLYAAPDLLIIGSSNSNAVRFSVDAANTLALRNGTTTQSFRVYNSFTDASNYSRLAINANQIRSEVLGSGSLAVTADAPVLDLQQTWNNSGVTFTGLKFNAAGTSDANSASGSLLLDLQLGGTPLFSFRKSGIAGFRTGIAAGANGITGYNSDANAMAFGGSGRASALGNAFNGLLLCSSYQVGFSNQAATADSFGNVDTIINRTAAGIIGVRGSNTTTGGALSFIEQTAPAAPAANGVYIYAEDDGAGKTRLMARFATGAAQQIAIEP